MPTHTVCAPGAAPVLASADARLAFIRTATPAEHDVLDGWCAGVGPAVVRTANASAAPVSHRVHALDELTVVSWNINVGGGDLEGLVRDLRAGHLTAGQPVAHFVVMVQEAYRADAQVPRTAAATRPRRIAPQPAWGTRRDIVAVAESLDLHLYYVPSMANGWARDSQLPEDRGNAVLSTLPLHDLAAIELPLEGQRRVAAVASVRGVAPNGTPWSLRLVNVHLDNRSQLQRVHRSVGLGRARQARALVAALPTDSTLVLAGDLNAWAPTAWEPALDVLRAHFPHGEAVRERTLAHAWGIGHGVLDHVMFRLPAHQVGQTRRLDDARGSDHYPLLTSVRLDAAQPALAVRADP